MNHPIARAAEPEFASTGFYTFHNDNDKDNTLFSGLFRDAGGNVSMAKAEVTSSSENWQLYYQQGRYFIRNYDYHGEYQLGLTAESLRIPRLYKRSGALGQQWSLNRKGDGKYTFTNGLLGNDSALALRKGSLIPTMQTSLSDASWDLVSNPNAGAPSQQDAAMMTDVEDFEIEEVPSSSTAVVSFPLPSRTPASTISGSLTSATTTTPTQTTNNTESSAPSLPSTSSSLVPGAIPGIVVGVVLLGALIGLLGYFLGGARRKPKAGADEKNPYTAETAAMQSSNGHTTYYTHYGQIQQQSQIGYRPLTNQAANPRNGQPQEDAPRYEAESIQVQQQHPEKHLPSYTTYK
ncbi:hypothetical protein K504DRAFT_455512 [Pleomassaria siparia CBS 279.74]|uniref:Uncharacterized protein n=1 Tax=Pleomassaria siparia CBS 279.74 TaxID=1314801 RepID=A0A6G1KB43_9PLEO|nr:hypothetical protein K504DRAFT_455512 [Pleomassaria siparia CBS 279.74]